MPKRESVLAMIEGKAYSAAILNAGVTPPGNHASAKTDPDYAKRLWLWLADCAARAVRLLDGREHDYNIAAFAITAARAERGRPRRAQAVSLRL